MCGRYAAITRVKAIEKRLKIPSIDTKSIAQMIFGEEILSKMNMAQEYHGKIKKYHLIKWLKFILIQILI